jgi:hypothetical protein
MYGASVSRRIRSGERVGSVGWGEEVARFLTTCAVLRFVA